jgi:NAD(P)-dependent dehydrogenase (short-subunit alcohol dehydrogenase family)
MIGRIYFENINLRNNAYSPLKAYSQSKLANILFTRELAKRLGKNSNIKVYCLHPGIIRTDLMRHIPLNVFLNLIVKIFFIDVEMGAQTTLFCALEESLDNETGLFYE